MIVFECPSCKAKMRAAEEYAGQTVVCPDCNAPTTIPASAETPVKAAATTPPPCAGGDGRGDQRGTGRDNGCRCPAAEAGRDHHAGARAFDHEIARRR